MVDVVTSVAAAATQCDKAASTCHRAPDILPASLSDGWRGFGYVRVHAFSGLWLRGLMLLCLLKLQPGTCPDASARIMLLHHSLIISLLVPALLIPLFIHPLTHSSIHLEVSPA